MFWFADFVNDFTENCGSALQNIDSTKKVYLIFIIRHKHNLAFILIPQIINLQTPAPHLLITAIFCCPPTKHLLFTNNDIRAYNSQKKKKKQ